MAIWSLVNNVECLFVLLSKSIMTRLRGTLMMMKTNAAIASNKTVAPPSGYTTFRKMSPDMSDVEIFFMIWAIANDWVTNQRWESLLYKDFSNLIIIHFTVMKLEKYQEVLCWIALFHEFSQTFKLNCWNSHIYSFLHAWMPLTFATISWRGRHNLKKAKHGDHLRKS